jgi:hypothetical protein
VAKSFSRVQGNLEYVLSLNQVASIKAEDAVFDGVLEVLLDVLKGATVVVIEQ